MNVAIIGNGSSCFSIASNIRKLLPKNSIVTYYYQYDLKKESLNETSGLEINKFIKFRNNLVPFYSKIANEYDVVFSCGWSHKVSPVAIKSEKFFNIHPSLLPQYKGKRPLERQIGDNIGYYGITLHKMDNDYDTGPIFEQVKFTTTNRLCIEQLSSLLVYGANLLIKDFLELYPNIVLYPQNENELWKKTIKYELELQS